MGKIAKNYFYSLAYQMLVLITPVITTPYLARILGAHNLGIYSYVNSSGNIITTISLLGIYAYGNRQTAYVRDNKEELTKTFWELEIVRLILGTIGTFIYFIYAKINSKYNCYFMLYYPYILSQFIDCSWIYVGLEDMRPAVVKNFVTKLVNVIGIFIFVRGIDDVWIYILMLAVTTLLANITIYSQIPKYVNGPKADVKNIWKHIRGSFDLFLPQVASLFYLQVDKVMLEWLTGTTEQVSFYDQAEKIINIPLSFVTVLSTVMMPRIANEFKKNNKDTITELLINVGRVELFLAFPLMLGLFVIASKFIPWYLGNEFMPTAYAMMILAPIVLFNSLTSISGAQYFTATNQIGILIKGYVSAAVLNFCVNAMLIPKLGYAGAAIATVGSSIISVIIQYYYLSKQMKIGAVLRYAFKYAIGSLVMAGGIFFFTRNLGATVTTTLIQMIIGGVIYMIFLIVTRDEMLKEFIYVLKKYLKNRDKL